MTTTLTPELRWLAATTVLTGALWIPYIADRMREHGIWKALANPDRDARPRAAWADRLMWAHDNAVENLVLFAALVLMLNALGISNATTVMACNIYFWARLAHYLIYSAGIPWLRTLSFTVAWVCILALLLQLF